MVQLNALRAREISSPDVHSLSDYAQRSDYIDHTAREPRLPSRRARPGVIRGIDRAIGSTRAKLRTGAPSLRFPPSCHLGGVPRPVVVKEDAGNAASQGRTGRGKRGRPLCVPSYERA